MPEQSLEYSFKEKYERQYGCNLTRVSANTDSEIGLVQKDINQLTAHLKIDGFNQDGCFADTTNFRYIISSEENTSCHSNEQQLSFLKENAIFRQKL